MSPKYFEESLTNFIKSISKSSTTNTKTKENIPIITKSFPRPLGF